MLQFCFSGIKMHFQNNARYGISRKNVEEEWRISEAKTRRKICLKSLKYAFTHTQTYTHTLNQFRNVLYIKENKYFIHISLTCQSRWSEVCWWQGCLYQWGTMVEFVLLCCMGTQLLYLCFYKTCVTGFKSYESWNNLLESSFLINLS